MGKYINTDSNGNDLPNRGKVSILVKDGAEIIGNQNCIPDFCTDMVCVVDNGIFEAAGYAYDEREFNVFTYPDGRPKIFLKYKHAKELAK